MKLTGRFLVAAAAVLLLFPAVADASFAKVGTAGAQFLKLGLGTRGAAMGGAFVATADDASAAWWNPACLVRVPGTQVQLTTTRGGKPTIVKVLTMDRAELLKRPVAH